MQAYPESTKKREISPSVNPLDALHGHDDEVVFQFFIGVSLEEWNQEFQDVPGCGWIHFQPDHPRVSPERKDNPIAEMLIESYKDPFFLDSFQQNLGIVRTRLSDLSGAHHIEPGCT